MSSPRRHDNDSSVPADDDGDQNALFRRRPLARSDSSTSAGSTSSQQQQAARLLEALEALTAHDAGGDSDAIGLPPSLRSLLGQLQQSDNAMAGLLPLVQMLEHGAIMSPGGDGGGQRFQRLLPSLAVDAPMGQQLSALSELCESLSLSSSDETLLLSGFSVDAFVPRIVRLIETPPSLEVLLLAARALVAMLDLLPTTAVSRAVADGIVPAVCAKLLELEFMDVAELAFQILDRVVRAASTHPEYRGVVLAANGLVALLQFVDFFPIEIQRTAARVVAALCLEPSAPTAIEPALPLVVNLLRASDREVLESGCISVQRLSASASLAPLVATDEVASLLLDVVDRVAIDNGQQSTATATTAVACASALRYFVAVLPSLDATTRRSRLPAVLQRLLLRDVVLTDVQVLRDALQIVDALLSLDPLQDDGNDEDDLKWRAALTPRLMHLYDVTSRRTLRHECLRVLLRAARQLKTVSRADAHRLASFLARVLRPDSRSAPDAALEQLHSALELVAASLETASTAARLRALFERYGVARAVRFYAIRGVDDSERRAAQVAAQATALAQTYFSDKTSALVQSLERLCTIASAITRATQSSDAAALTAALQSLRAFEHDYEDEEAADADAEDVWLTAHELASSGLSLALIGVLHSAVGRALFAETFGASDESLSRLRSLVASLQDAIAAERDVFCVDLALPLHADRRGVATPFAPTSGSIAADVEQLTQHLKIQVCIEEEHEDAAAAPNQSDADVHDEKSTEAAPSEDDRSRGERRVGAASGLRGSFRRWGRQSSSASSSSSSWRQRHAVHNTVVLVEPLARIETIEEFIADKVFGGKPSTMHRRHHHRRHRRRRQRAVSQEEKQDDDEAENEEPMGEEVQEEEEEEDEEQVEDDDDGDDAEEDEQQQAEEGDDLRNDRPRKASRVEVWLHGRRVPREMSVLEALVKAGHTGSVEAQTSGDAVALRRLWSATPHSLVFRVLRRRRSRPEQPASEDDSLAASPVCDPMAVAAVATRWWDDVWQLLTLLTLVYDAVSPSTRAELPPLVNAAVSLQVTRALSQPWRVVLHALPEWCTRMMQEFWQVLDWETRGLFVTATRCGSSRAVQSLCRTLWKRAVLEEREDVDDEAAADPSRGRMPTSSRERRRRRLLGEDSSASASSGSRATMATRTASLLALSRMVKLPRLKVRVARSRLLPSAVKLLSIYGGKQAVIEIEFLGEVGTGLGPTTEFYTLVCQELQAARLQLWRSEDSVQERSSELTGGGAQDPATSTTSSASSPPVPGLPVRGYHRVAVYLCGSCKRLQVPRCALHNVLLTREKKDTAPKKRKKKTATTSTDATETSEATQPETPKTTGKKAAKGAAPSEADSIAQCSQCLDAQDWHTPSETCEHCSDASMCRLHWWILSDEEVLYLDQVFPQGAASTLRHPVLQCSHCETVNFPGTDAGIVVLDREQRMMVARTGRRMFERDYRAVTKHISPLCEGTPLRTIPVELTRSTVELLASAVRASPEVLESEVESLSSLGEAGSAASVLDAVVAPFGLFPRPLAVADQEQDEEKAAADEEHEAEEDTEPSAESQVLAWFRFLGRLIAQAWLDERLLNLPLSKTLLRALRGERLAGPDVPPLTSIAYVREFDPAIAQSLQALWAMTSCPPTGTGEPDDDDVAAMGLTFTLLGDAKIELCRGGAERAVTRENLAEYVALQLSFLLDVTIRPQLVAFDEGFASIAKCSSRAFLSVFSVDELDAMLSDTATADSLWDREGHELRQHMVCAHGYSPSSRAIEDLIAVLCALPVAEQRLFVRFVTGADRLPLGGLRQLDPKLTVVRKLAASGSEDGDPADSDAMLPSASTCTNYLKLPEYSTRELLAERLQFCIREGQGSFHLS
ncbi:hypothetical protein ATCC90586_007956 [Pythium insidiosum]|nr:hypothetical protein ATCC90586_007956 [Pythium insidiosum]